ncbi:MAG TPA: hypothetical protein VK909_21320, partial [Anaerolineales bacterium]|nr:hypothetical protein [Anaerolineales bacterium]
SVAEITINSLITLWAIEFSALLAAAYLPAYMILRSRALMIAEPADKPAESREWLKESGLDLNFLQMISRILTIIAPMLASPVINILSQFVQ